MSIERGGGACSNFSYGRSTNAPNGCLINPEGSTLIFFEISRKLQNTNIKIYTHIFYTNHLCEPEGFRYTAQLDIDRARKKWNELLSEGWTEAHHNYG